MCQCPAAIYMFIHFKNPRHECSRHVITTRVIDTGKSSINILKLENLNLLFLFSMIDFIFFYFFLFHHFHLKLQFRHLCSEHKTHSKFKRVQTLHENHLQDWQVSILCLTIFFFTCEFLIR